MSKISSYFSLFLVAGMVLGGACLPNLGLAAIKTPVKKAVPTKKLSLDLYNPKRHYGDEKAEIVDPSSRCNTPALQKIHLQNLERAKQDGKPYDLTFESVSTTEALKPLEQAYKKYIEGLSFAWGAMEEPYCGFGAFGTQAARKSYDKSVERARARFLDVVKREKAAIKKMVPKMVAERNK